MTGATEVPSNLWIDVAEKAQAALVHVSAGCRRGATGSVLGGPGVVVTTARALAGRQQLEVTQGDAETSAEVVGVDWATDIGILRPANPIGTAPALRDQPVRLGEQVLVGSRPGRAARVRAGLVSQIGDSWHSPRGGRVERYVELDVSAEPGFSGGLVFDVQGNAVGLSAAGLLRGVPLVLEKATLDRVLSELLAHGRVRRGYLGVGTQAVRLPDALREQLGQPAGLLVTSVQPGSAAERAGLLIGDVLLELEGTRLRGPSTLLSALENAEGRTLPLRVLRAGQQLDVDVTPGARA